MNILLAISLAAALAYLYLSIRVGGRVPVSLSATYYDLGAYGWVFQVAMATVALTLMPVWIGCSKDSHCWMAFMACASLLFVAAAPCFRLEPEGRIHYTSAAVCCICAVSWQLAEELWDVMLWFALMGGMCTLMWRHQWCWWMEAAVIGSVYANLFRLAL